MRRMLVPWVRLFVETGAWGVAAVLKWLHWARELPGRECRGHKGLVVPWPLSLNVFFPSAYSVLL